MIITFFSDGLRIDVDIIDKILSFLFALPNMFISKFLDVKLFPYVGQRMLSIGANDELSNTTDAMGHIFPSKADSIELLLWSLILLLIGVIAAYIYRRSLSNIKRFSTTIAIYMTFFVFFSFFGTFYINSNPWEILVYSLFVPKLFMYKKASKQQYNKIGSDNNYFIQS